MLNHHRPIHTIQDTFASRWHGAPQSVSSGSGRQPWLRAPSTHDRDLVIARIDVVELAKFRHGGVRQVDDAPSLSACARFDGRRGWRSEPPPPQRIQCLNCSRVGLYAIVREHD